MPGVLTCVRDMSDQPPHPTLPGCHCWPCPSPVATITLTPWVLPGSPLLQLPNRTLQTYVTTGVQLLGQLVAGQKGAVVGDAESYACCRTALKLQSRVISYVLHCSGKQGFLNVLCK